jgi:hypothetical protein
MGAVSDEAEEAKDQKDDHDRDDYPEDSSGPSHFWPLLSTRESTHQLGPRFRRVGSVLATKHSIRLGEKGRPPAGRSFPTGHPRCDRDPIAVARDQEADSIRRIDRNDEPVVGAERCWRNGRRAARRRDRTVEVAQDDW